MQNDENYKRPPGQKNGNPFQIGGPEWGTPKRYFIKSSHEGGCHISDVEVVKELMKIIKNRGGVISRMRA
jgi:hypothetical protein